MNKKGVDATRSMLYTIAELVVGVSIMVILIISVPKLMFGSTEQVMSKDFALSIMTISAAPYDIAYNYEKNTEQYKVQITPDEVIIISKDGAGRYPYFSMRGITITAAIIQNTLSIPMSLKDSTLKFTNEDVSFTDNCVSIPQTFNNANSKMAVRFFVQSDESGEAKTYLQLLATTLNSKARYDPNTKVAYLDQNDASTTNDAFIFSFGTSQTEGINIYYYEDPQHPLNTAWSKRIACYMQRTIQLNHADQFKSIQMIASSKQEIKVVFGPAEKYINLSKDNSVRLTSQISKELFDAINQGLTN